jgi:transposase
MQNKQLFEMALGEIGPWQIESIEFKEQESGEKELHIRLDFVPGSTFKNQGGEAQKAYDTSWHTWRHLNFFEHRCYLQARVPRIANSDGGYEKAMVPWGRSMGGFTLLFEQYVMGLIDFEMPVKCVGELVKENDQRIWNIFHYYVAKGRKNTIYENIKEVGIDETSTRKGHNYVTVGVDLEKRRVFEVADGKGMDAVARLGDFLEEKGSPKSEISQVSIDMSPAFISGCGTTFPNADITFDHFHVTKEVNKALDELRILERKECQLLKGHKYTLLKNPENLSEKKQAELQNLITLYPKIGEAYRLKELFKEFWNIDTVEMAELFLKDWCEQALKSGIIPYRKTVNTIKAHWSGILNYVKSNISNGILEGINSKIQLAKKRARGYRNMNNFKNMILFICGNLEHSYP